MRASFLWAVVFFLFNPFTASARSTIDWSLQKGLVFEGEKGELAFGLDTEMGCWYDWGLYASFGLEFQIFRFSKLVLPITGTWRLDNPDYQWLLRCEIAPLYDSVHKDQRPFKRYNYDTAGRPVDGATIYRDWYKNLGSRMYYLGNIPLVQLYGGFQTPHHQIKLGRLKNFVSFDDDETPWKDDAKMAPMGYWLSKDLLTGLTYRFNWRWLFLTAGVFSGHNPLKSHASYLYKDGVQDPNTKANNTATYAGRLAFAGDFTENVKGQLFAAYQSTIAGSTWADVFQDGKRLAHVGAVGSSLTWTWPELWLQSVKLFAQYTFFQSGLDPTSVQNRGQERYKALTQHGVFAGLESTFKWGLSAWMAFEIMDRYDYNLYELGGFNANDPLRNKVQRSFLVGGRYAFLTGVSLSLAFHFLENPTPYASQVWDKKSDNRWKLTLEVQLGH